MKREIKFRAWCYLTKKMIPPSEVEEHSIEDVMRSFEWDVQQFTGLKDKNGKDIYEGDIVKSWVCCGPAGQVQHTHEVKIGSWGVNIQEWSYIDNLLPEIIGNIHENPELLEPQENS